MLKPPSSNEHLGRGSNGIEQATEWLDAHGFMRAEISQHCDIFGNSDDLSRLYQQLALDPVRVGDMEFGISLERSFLFLLALLGAGAKGGQYDIHFWQLRDSELTNGTYQLDLIFVSEDANLSLAKGILLGLCEAIGVGKDEIDIIPTKLCFVGPAAKVSFWQGSPGRLSGQLKGCKIGFLGIIRPEVWKAIGANPDTLGLHVAINLSHLTCSPKTRPI